MQTKWRRAPRGLLIVTLLVLAFQVVANAQATPTARNVLTNRGIITLARAGFDEEFIADVVLSSRSQFDTSVEGLAALAGEGISMRIIRLMMNPKNAPQDQTSADAPSADVPVTVAPPAIAPSMNVVASAPYGPPASQAIADRVPFYRWDFLLWGVWSRKTGVGSPIPRAASCCQSKVSVKEHLGPILDAARQTRHYIPLGQTSDTATVPLVPKTPVLP